MKATQLFQILLSLALCAAAVHTAGATGPVSFRVIYNVEGYQQPGGILEESPGVFYTTAAAPTVVFSVTSAGSQTILGTFPTGPILQSPIVSGPNNRVYSAIYGATYNVFSVTSAPGGLKVYPANSLDPALTQNLPDGTLLALASSAGVWGPAKCDLTGNVTSLAQLPGSYRLANVIYATDGNYYGVAQGNFTSDGYIFRLTTSGPPTTLYTFPTNTFTAWLATPLWQASDGNLYGAAVTGGANGTGMIYKLTLAGDFTLLYSFGKGTFGRGPFSLVEASDANLYGVSTTNEDTAQIFRVSKSGQYTPLYAMNNSQGGPPCWLIQGSDGNLYGTAHAGGSAGLGSIFALSAGLPKPKPQALSFMPRSGSAGTQVRTWGNNLLSATVQFSGTPATGVSNSGPNYVWATVPGGAASGPITVTTPGGTFTTKQSFTVR